MTPSQPNIDLSKFQTDDNDFAHLSLRDLVQARDLFHAMLLRHPNVVATAIGRYRIRKTDSWPNARKKRHGTGVRRLDNSEVRPYSWPCILVFVSQWQDPRHFATHPEDMVPGSLYTPDGTRVPVCVVEAPKQSVTPIAAQVVNRPINNIGSGSPLIATVQGQTYLATVGCLVSDGHKVYALTNRHVTGEPGEVVASMLGSHPERVGASSPKFLTRVPLSTLYPNFQVQDTFVNLDIGLVDVDDVSAWTTKIPGIGTPGPMADYSGGNLSLSLVGCQVRGIGAASGEMLGEIQGLFYRYKTGGGFEYVADIFIGPRTAGSAATSKFETHPGDSGTLWLLEPAVRPGHGAADKPAQFLPLALQWGRNMLLSAEKAPPQSFALATLLSRVCAMLEVDPVRGWNVDQDDTWGALGHFAIAARTNNALSTNFPKLKSLMDNNALIVSHDDDALEKGDFTGLGSADFVPMADVPDFFWKPRVAKQGFARFSEGPNHFADMDQPSPDGDTLLDLTKTASNIDPDVWNSFYDSVKDLMSGDPIEPKHRGLLPFRVWQIFNGMCDFVADGDAERFVCAAGVLTHYLGDACQPLHISYLHDGDPLRPVDYTFQSGKKAGQTEQRPTGQGVHSAYEDKMVFVHRKEILAGLMKTPKVKKSELITTGREAAERTVDLMRATFKALPPPKMVQTYVDAGGGSSKAVADVLWKAFGQKTIGVMQDGAHLLAVMWESAWSVGGGERTISRRGALSEKEAMDIVKDPSFLPSVTIDKIGALLK